MVAGPLRNPSQLLGERQAAEHVDGLHHVLVDLEALAVGQGAALDAQVEDLAMSMRKPW